MQRTAPSKTVGVEIELPDFDEMFRRIQAVSPLARLAVQGGGSGEGGGFAAVDDTSKYLLQHLMHLEAYFEFDLMSYVSTALFFVSQFRNNHSSARRTKMEEPRKEQTKDGFSG